MTALEPSSWRDSGIGVRQGPECRLGARRFQGPETVRELSGPGLDGQPVAGRARSCVIPWHASRARGLWRRGGAELAARCGKVDGTVNSRRRQSLGSHRRAA